MLGFRLPYIKRTGIRASHDGIEVEDHGDPSGIGDLALFGQYRFLNDKTSQHRSGAYFWSQDTDGRDARAHAGRRSARRRVPTGLGIMGPAVRAGGHAPAWPMVVRRQCALQSRDHRNAVDRSRRSVSLQCRCFLQDHRLRAQRHRCSTGPGRMKPATTDMVIIISCQPVPPWTSFSSSTASGTKTGPAWPFGRQLRRSHHLHFAGPALEPGQLLRLCIGRDPCT